MRAIFHKNFDKNTLKMQGKFSEFWDKNIKTFYLNFAKYEL